MLSSDDAPRIAAAFELGELAAMTGPVARGVIGQIWRLDTDRGSWTQTEWFEQPDVDELAEGVAFQEAVNVRGVPTPTTVRTAYGDWRINLDGARVQLRGWGRLLD